MQRVLLALFLALIVLAPLPLGSNRPLPALALAFGLGMTLLLWSLAALRDPALVSIPQKRSLLLAGPFLLYLLWAWSLVLPGFAAPHSLWFEAAQALDRPLSARAAISPSAAAMTLINVMAYGTAFWLALHLGRRSGNARTILGTLAVAMAAYALYGLVMLLGGFDKVLWYDRWAYRDSVTSTFVNRNNYATYAGMGLLLTLALFIEQLHRAAQLAAGGLRSAIVATIDGSGAAIWLLMTASLVIGTSLVLTGSRAGVASSGIAVVALLAAFGLARGAQTKIWLLALLVVGAGAVATLAVSGEVLLSRLVDLEANAGSRLTLLELALHQIAERPWFGYGPGSFPVVFELTRSEAFDGDIFSYQRVHNTYLEVALESGLPGLALLLAAMLGPAVLCLRGILRRREATVFPAIALAATVLVGLHSLVDFGLQVPAVSVTYFTLLGLGVAQSWSHADIEDAGRPPAAGAG